MKLRARTFLYLVLATSSVALSGAASASTATGTIGVSMTLQASCTLSSSSARRLQRHRQRHHHLLNSRPIAADSGNDPSGGARTARSPSLLTTAGLPLAPRRFRRAGRLRIHKPPVSRDLRHPCDLEMCAW